MFSNKVHSKNLEVAQSPSGDWEADLASTTHTVVVWCTHQGVILVMAFKTMSACSVRHCRDRGLPLSAVIMNMMYDVKHFSKVC